MLHFSHISVGVHLFVIYQMGSWQGIYLRFQIQYGTKIYRCEISLQKRHQTGNKSCIYSKNQKLISADVIKHENDVNTQFIQSSSYFKFQNIFQLHNITKTGETKKLFKAFKLLESLKKLENMTYLSMQKSRRQRLFYFQIFFREKIEPFAEASLKYYKRFKYFK